MSRRTLLWAVPSVGLYVAGGSRLLGVFTDARTRLYSSTVAIGDDQRRVLVPPDETWTEPGSRVLRSAGQYLELRQQELKWQEQSQVSGTAGQREVSRLALLDLRALTVDGGPVVAGWSGYWRFVWPRDSAFVVAAYAATGHTDDAAAVLAFVQRVQAADGTFQARYGPTSERPPDRRGVQLDGIGWSLWGLSQWAKSLPVAERVLRLRRFALLLDRSASACLRLTAGGTTLPPVSPDYWEVDTKTLTLGNAALFLVGLQSAARVYDLLGDADRAAVLREAGRRYRTVLTRNFAGHGYPRKLGGRARDAAVAFLLPPFVEDLDPDVLEAWRLAGTELLRPAGGLAPGAKWTQDGVSWTPGTAAFAVAAVGIGDHEQAARWLDWLLAHRTAAGSFSEKVLSNGRPAAVAPLAWTTAGVILALNPRP
jgi:glucoamylase